MTPLVREAARQAALVCLMPVAFVGYVLAGIIYLVFCGPYNYLLEGDVDNPFGDS